MTLPFAEWLPQQRWYAGRGRTIAGVTAASVTPLSDSLDHTLIRVDYTEGDPHVYQVIVGWDRVPSDEFLGVSRIGEQDGRTGYDALYDERACREILAMVIEGRTVDHLRFRPEPNADFLDEVPARVIDAEQSNTSVVFNTSSILKLYRRVVPGINPDLELNRALGRAGSPHVAHLLGAIEGDWIDATADGTVNGTAVHDDRNGSGGHRSGGQPVTFATVTVFARNSADGWSMAAASARDLLTEHDLRADEAGGDFAAEAHRLGEAVASVHAMLADEFGSEVAFPPVDSMIDRLHAAADAVPRIAEYLGVATDCLRRASYPTTVHRVHGDLHLGQVLRSPEHWLLIDFEGEPGQPMPQRQQPDSPMRDVAGMLRSFDYAAYQLMVTERGDASMRARANEWAQRNRSAFCDGYAKVAGEDPREHADLLIAYELDKAAYEAAYESRHRPSWLWIPLDSIDRLLTGSPR